MGGKEIGLRSDVFFTFYFLLSTFYFLIFRRRAWLFFIYLHNF
ncbi:MAG: hypothetical protein AB1422_18705 [bacterium]